VIAKILLLTLAWSTLLPARENPFAPARDFESEPLTKPIPAPEFDDKIVPIIQKAICVSAKPKPTAAPKPAPVWKPTPKKPAALTPPAPKPVTVKPKVHRKPKVVKKHRKIHHAERYNLLYRNDNLRIYAGSHRIKIVTTDCLQKHFRLTRPDRIVLDFGDDFVIYPSIARRVHHLILREIRIGTHACFYRVTLQLDRPHRYSLSHRPYGYLITLR